MLEAIQTPNAPAAIGPYSQAIKAGGFLFLSGQIPLDPQTGKLVEGGIEAQTEQVLKNIHALLTAAGIDFSHVARSEVYLKDLNDFQAMNVIYTRYFSQDPKPVRQTLQVAKIPLDSRVEISCIAVLS